MRIVSRWRRRGRRASVHLAALGLAVAPGSLTAQARGGDSTAAAVRTTGALQDAPISRATYQLGPGDVLDVAILGALNRVFTVSVSPDGTVLLPAMGLQNVSGLTIDRAERSIRELVLRFYREVTVRVSLAQVRAFKVFLVGDVPNPGVRPATAVTRVSELVPAGAGGLQRRNVLLRRASGDTVSVDLVRFAQTGDLRDNPVLREGDALILPTVDETVQIYGRVHFPGVYEHRPGETLADLLQVANGGGPLPSNAADTIRMSRFTGRQEREVRTLTVAEATGAAGTALRVQPFDAFFVPAVANYKVQRIATIGGQVVRPGAYPIRPETTTVRNLVAMAGGFTPEASLVDATLHRVPRGTGSAQARQLEAIPPELLSSDERRILQARARSDPNAVVIDFRALFEAGRAALDHPLESGDSIDVPVRQTGVVVLGAVRTPGIVPFALGRTLSDYVQLAGGYGRRADRRNQTVLKAQLGNLVDSRDVRSIDAGDQIVVPYREPTRYWQRAQQVVTTVAGTVLTIVSLKELLNL